MQHLWAGLAANPALPAEAVGRLLAIDDTEVAWALAERTDLTEQQIPVLAERTRTAADDFVADGRLVAEQVDPARQPHAALALLRARQAPVEWAELLIERPELWRELAQCPDLPAEPVRRMLADADPEVLAELAECTTDPETAAALAAHPSEQVRQALGFNPAAPSDVLADLINDRPPLGSCDTCRRHAVPWRHPADCPDPDCDLPAGAACDGSHQYARHSILQAVLGHPAAPVADAVRHLDDPSPFLRAQLAERPDLHQDAYRRLAADQNLWVLAALAENPAVGQDLVRRLAAHPHEHVQRAAACHPGVPLDVLDRLAATGRLGNDPLPRIDAADEAELALLAASANPELRRLTALRRDLPAPVRDLLAADPVAKVAAAVAARPGLGEARLRAVHARHGRLAAPGIAANPEAPAGLLRELVAGDHNVATLRALAAHPAADATVLTACLRDKRARRQAAAHPALPVERLRELLDDPDRVTAAAAAANPALPVTDLLRLMPQSR
ncbi:hypothetical protein [Streptomyces sp. TLI_171]|uniref:hypothetical protein n=1 Tax=Streptomyces sp. TLI_171 TaxID=1938859 RepID=UPI000C1945A5|nr:hypothetical protein [Streptomyces sp. TLI_171]RKE18108.1 hypothetical protein BX266_1388 [Streptomyces sp. TLI_171]